MPITQKRLYQGQPAVTNTVLYTTPAATSAVVKDVLVTNTTGGVVSFDLHVAPSATATAIANAVVYKVSLQANGIFQLSCSLVCNTGDTIRALQSVASALTINISGYEVT